MTQEELDEMISEVIVSQEKPKSRGNSYFRKREEKRILHRWLNSTTLMNVETNFYKHFVQLRNPKTADYMSNHHHMYVWRDGDFVGCRCIWSKHGVRYNSLTGRLKILANCEPRKDVRNKRMLKRIKRRQLRKSKVEIANGSAYKKFR